MKSRGTTTTSKSYFYHICKYNNNNMIGFDLNDGFRYKKYLFNLLKKKEPDKIISGDRF